MNESPDTAEHLIGPLGRRSFLTKAAAAGAIAWTAPMILSSPAYAADGGGGTPNCRPTVSFQCFVHSCDQGSKMFPGITATVSNCPCSHTTPPQRPVTCIKITDITACGNEIPTAYGNGTDCSPNSPPDVILSTGNWVCFDPLQPIFFGRARSGNGAIPNLSNCTFTFRMGVWSGSCPDRDSTGDAFICQTFDVTVDWSGAGSGSVSCTFTPASAANSLCTNVPANVSPCGTCP